MKRLFLLLSLTLLSSQARFGEAPFSLTFEGRDFSPGGQDSTSAYSTRLRVSAPLFRNEKHIAAAVMTLKHSWYDQHYLGLDSLNQAQLGLFTLSNIGEHWRAMSISSVNYKGEGGVNFSDALSYSGVYGVWYSGWENLLLGVGAVASYDLESEFQFIPIIFLDWEFYDHWHLTTRPTPGTLFGPGVSVSYLSGERWALYFGARYISTEFRLQDDSLYEERYGRLFTTLEYNLTENLTLNTTLGASLGGEVEYQGKTEDLDAGFFTGLDLSWRF